MFQALNALFSPFFPTSAKNLKCFQYFSIILISHKGSFVFMNFFFHNISIDNSTFDACICREAKVADFTFNPRAWNHYFSYRYKFEFTIERL